MSSRYGWKHICNYWSCLTNSSCWETYKYAIYELNRMKRAMLLFLSKLVLTNRIFLSQLQKINVMLIHFEILLIVVIVGVAHGAFCNFILEQSNWCRRSSSFWYGEFCAITDYQMKYIKNWMTKTDKKSNCCLKQHFVFADEHLCNSWFWLQ